MKKIIYDLGANEGKNIPYYLLKSDLVIAVEANPELCLLMNKLYKDDIANHKLIIENSVVTNQETSIETFYISKFGSYFSTCVPGKKNIYLGDRLITKKDYDEKIINSINILELFKKYGVPYYVKIDIEHFDEFILREILDNFNDKPTYLSCECQDFEIFNLLINSKDYNSFKFIEGSSIHEKYSKHKFKDIKNQNKEFSFKMHSAGPFGDDINGPWFDLVEFKEKFSELVNMKLAPGWLDIHCRLA